MKISHDITLNKQLKWPKYGSKILYLTVFYFFGMTFIGSNINIQVTNDLGLPISKFFISIFGLIINVFVTSLLFFNVLLFFLSWIEKFGDICKDHKQRDACDHAQKCLDLFRTLQKGLGLNNFKANPDYRKFFRINNFSDFFKSSINNNNLPFYEHIFKYEHNS